MKRETEDLLRRLGDSEWLAAVGQPLPADLRGAVVAVSSVPGGTVEVGNTLRWDILGACMELEYADIREPGFFCGLMAWYLAGRFPCGWGERGENGAIRLYGPEDVSGYDPNEPDWLKLVLSNQERLFRPKIAWPAAGKLLVY
jgi:hypothetical protein